MPVVKIKGGAAGAGAAGLTAAVIGKMSLDEMRQRLKTATDEKDRALLNEAITKAVAEAKDYVETKPTTSPRPKARPMEWLRVVCLRSMPKVGTLTAVHL